MQTATINVAVLRMPDHPSVFTTCCLDPTRKPLCGLIVAAKDAK